ncbi:hypothetical protein [Sphingosinicella sp. BN140058]|uniref:hypothetical protein n=1 Tax=Sphingosinicella sp. BN140058 TaxID=1892855 RepID=UPI0013E9C9C1|nr:hypothetical protein [Sphingosinicella sp. BN140058]
MLYNRIEDARVLKDPQDTDGPRLGTITATDVPADLRQGRGCRLVQGERLLLLANARGAIARLDGRILRLRIGGPLGPSGGFFVADGASVSIGRTVPAAGQQMISQGPATVSVGGARDRPIEKVDADWACS